MKPQANFAFENSLKDYFYSSQEHLEDEAEFAKNLNKWREASCLVYVMGKLDEDPVLTVYTPSTHTWQWSSDGINMVDMKGSDIRQDLFKDHCSVQQSFLRQFQKDTYLDQMNERARYLSKQTCLPDILDLLEEGEENTGFFWNLGAQAQQEVLFLS